MQVTIRREGYLIPSEVGLGEKTVPQEGGPNEQNITEVKVKRLAGFAAQDRKLHGVAPAQQGKK